MWPKAPYQWVEDRTLYMSIPFTWNLPQVREHLKQRSFMWDTAVVGGPAVILMPHYFSDMSWVQEWEHMDGVLQRVNPNATRTTLGCTNRCRFCAVPTIEGPFKELDEWPDNPILCDNNLLAASEQHFDRVIDRLECHTGVDFNQGLDCRLLTRHHAERIGRIKAKVRLALDSKSVREPWEVSVSMLRETGTAKSMLSCYILVGFTDTPEEAWEQCKFVEAHGVTPNPQWFHSLDCLKVNSVSDNQKRLGWTHEGRTHIMGHFYRRRGEPL